ncbi:hypothetical protein ABH974_002889 [Bradyrhizobium ottawaense]
MTAAFGSRLPVVRVPAVDGTGTCETWAMFTICIPARLFCEKLVTLPGWPRR